MQYHLKTLDELVKYKLNPLKQKCMTSNEMLELFLDVAQSENQRIKVSMIETVLHLKEERYVKHFIQQHQLGVISLLDSLLGIIGKTEALLKSQAIIEGSKIITVQKIVFLVLEDLLHFIENRYTSFCNLGIKLSDKYLLLQIRDFKVKVEFIHSKFNNDIPELVELALEPIYIILDKLNIKITYKEMAYRKELLRTIYSIVETKEIEDIEHELFKALTYLNFHTIYLINYIVRKINHEINRLDSIEEKKDRLAWYLKMFNQSQIKPGYNLYAENRSVIAYLTDWIMEESCYLEKKSLLQGLNREEQSELIGKTIKMETNLTVPQMACFVRLLVEVGAIKGMVKEDIIRFYSTDYKSKFQENISQGSFHSKYFAIDASVKEDIKGLIINMLNELSKLKSKA